MLTRYPNFLILCGLAAPVLWVGQIVAAGLVLPGFNPVTHYISELGAQGAVTALWVRWGAFGLTGLLYVLFALSLLSMRKGWALAVAVLLALDGLGRMGAGLFNCDAGCDGISARQHWHHVCAVLGFVSGNLAAFVCTWGLWRDPRRAARTLARQALLCAVSAALCLLLLKQLEGPGLPFGLFEHLASGILSVWLFAFARWRWRNAAAPSPTDGTAT